MNAPSTSKGFAFVRRAIWVPTLLLVLIGVAIVVRRTVILAPAVFGAAGVRAPNPAPTAEFDAIFARQSVLTLVHILPALVFVVLGPLQFSPAWRARHLRWHRWLGRVYVVAGLIVGGSALVMSFAMPAIGGINQAAATTLFGALFLFALLKGYRHARRREIARHREWMIRAFALGLGVATIRPIIGIFFATSRLSGLTPREFFGIAFWIGFVLHLVVAESWINLTRPEPVGVGRSPR